MLWIKIIKLKQTSLLETSFNKINKNFSPLWKYNRQEQRLHIDGSNDINKRIHKYVDLFVYLSKLGFGQPVF